MKPSDKAFLVSLLSLNQAFGHQLPVLIFWLVFGLIIMWMSHMWAKEGS